MIASSSRSTPFGRDEAEPAVSSPTDPLPGSLEQMPLPALLALAQRETAQFRRQTCMESRFAFEVFRRALLLRDEDAWAALFALYQNMVATWIIHRAQTACVENLEALVNEAFAKFARAIPQHAFHRFATTAALLSYLKACAQSCAADEWRRGQGGADEESLDLLAQHPPDVDPAEAICERLAAADLWQVVRLVVRGEDERLILEQHILHGVPLRDLPRTYPQWFLTAADAYRSKRRLLDRLRRNRDVRAWLCEDQ